jgi:hypothetical protein
MLLMKNGEIFSYFLALQLSKHYQVKIINQNCQIGEQIYEFISRRYLKATYV